MNTRPGVPVMEQLDSLPCRSRSGKQLVIAIATRTIHTKQIFMNGLYQNILFLYKLFRCLGHQPILLTHEKPSRENADLLVEGGYEILTPEQVVSMSVVFDVYIEIGMSTHVAFIHRMRAEGTRIVKLYLGNALNIDTEMIVDGNHVHFPHHTYSELDEMWTSPHYAIHLDYLCGLYRVPISSGKLAPYIWDSEFINERITWKRPRTGWESMNIVIAEPNISYQKCALVPLLLANMFYLRETEWKGHIILMNSGRLTANVSLMAGLFSDLDIVRDRRVVFKEREDILTLMKSNSSALFISHQLNNEFNYMTLELMWKGWPVLHTTNAWKSYGYFWEDTRVGEGVDLIKRVMKEHTGDEGRYAADARLLAWSYSMYNPEVQRKWQDLLLRA